MLHVKLEKISNYEFNGGEVQVKDDYWRFSLADVERTECVIQPTTEYDIGCILVGNIPAFLKYLFRYPKFVEMAKNNNWECSILGKQVKDVHLIAENTMQ